MDEQWRLGDEPPHFQDEEIIDPNVGADSDSSDNDAEGTSQTFNNDIDYRQQCRYLKKKLKFLIYENEFFQESLQTNQRKLLKVCKDKSFLLDRLLQYEKPDGTGSETDETESSDDEKDIKRRKMHEAGSSTIAHPATGSVRGRKKKILGQKRPMPHPQPHSSQPQPPIQKPIHTVVQHPPQESGHNMTLEEVERHLQSRPQPIMSLLTERAPPTVPQEMFSNEPSLESEPTSPSNLVVAAEEYITLEY